MKNLSFEVTVNPENYNKWEFQKKYLSEMDGIDEQMRQKLLNALNTLETELGKSFLKRYSWNHPLRQKISNKAKWQICEVIQFTDVLQSLKTNDSNYEIVIPKLLSERNSIIEGVPFVDIAQTYLKDNFKVWFLDEVPNTRTPDMKITNLENQEVFYVEITTLDDREERNEQRQDYDFFHNEFHNIPPYSSFYGKQHLPLVNEHFEFKKIIAEVKNKVKHEQKIVFYSNRHFYFIMAPPIFNTELQKICERENMRTNDIEGLPLRFNYVNQIRSKIGKKLTQIPHASNGIIYININTMFFMVTDLADAIPRIEESMSSSKEILGVVIYSKIVDIRKNEVIKFDKHLFTRRTIENYSFESLYIHNSNCEVVISDRTIEKILQTFA